jgi:DNA-binding CsgD family transcriptional regulator
VAEWLATALQKTEVEFPHQALSARELEIMRLLAAGKSLKEIATALSISVKMVGTYHGRLLEKMGMRSDAEITRYALLHKLVD